MDKEVISDLTPGIIEDQTFDFTVLIDGHQYDSTVIRNCVFENIDGDGLQLKDVDNLVVENCTFRDISGNAIRFRNTGSSNGVVIRNNEILNIEKSGISSAADHLETIIDNNTIHNVATLEPANQFSTIHHGIMFKGLGVTITNNEIYDVVNIEGNCISVRSSGYVSGNRLYNAAENGVSYYSDTDAIDGDLLIENNVIFDVGRRGVSLSSGGNAYNHVSTATVRFNTIMSKDMALIGVNDLLNDAELNFHGNVLVCENEDAILIFSNVSYNGSKNLTANSDIGFVNYEQRDFHLQPSSSAVNFATNVPDFPSVDFEGDPRSANNLDAGADEL